MNPDAAAPAPVPADGPVAVGGPSYPLSYRVAATLVVLGLVCGLWQMREPVLALPWSRGSLALAGGAVALLLMGWGHLLRSRTVLRGDTIEHGWLWTERIDWRDVSQVQLLHWPSLAWLIAPRLTVRARGRGRHRIPLADPQVLARVRELVYGPAD